MKRWLLMLLCGLGLAWSGWGVFLAQAEEQPAAKKDEAEKPAAASDKDAHAKDAHAKDAHAKDEHAKDGHDAKPEAEAAGHGQHAAGGHDEHAAGAHGHHDPLDLSHANGSAQLKSAQEMRFDLAIATFVVFVLLLLILTKFAWKPIAHGLDQREETIARQIAEAKAGAEKAALQLKEYEARLAVATEEARQIVSQARKDAETAKEKIVADAQAVAAKERDRAVADITTAKNQALHEIAEKSVSTALSLASKIISREVRPEDHDQLINQSLKQFTSLN